MNALGVKLRDQLNCKRCRLCDGQVRRTFDSHESVDGHGLRVMFHGGQLVEETHAVMVFLRL